MTTASNMNVFCSKSIYHSSKRKDSILNVTAHCAYSWIDSTVILAICIVDVFFFLSNRSDDFSTSLTATSVTLMHYSDILCFALYGLVPLE